MFACIHGWMVSRCMCVPVVCCVCVPVVCCVRVFDVCAK